MNVLFLRFLKEGFICLMEDIKQKRVFPDLRGLLFRSVFSAEGKELINGRRVVLRNLFKELINGILQLVGRFGNFRPLISEKIVEQEIFFRLLVFINGKLWLFIAFRLVVFVVFGFLVGLFILSLVLGFVFLFFLSLVGFVFEGDSDFGAFGGRLCICDSDGPRLLIGLGENINRD